MMYNPDCYTCVRQIVTCPMHESEDTDMSVKLTGLTADNIRALRETYREDVELTKTTATFPNAAVAQRELEWIIGSLPNAGFPRAALYAVVRKLKKAGA